MRIMSLKANAHKQHLRVATDGGFNEASHEGTVGIAVEQSYVGAKITSTVFSSTNTETAAALVLSLAFQILNTPVMVIDPDKVTWFCDARNVGIQQKSKSVTDPGSIALRPLDIPRITWDRGHAHNEWIKGADTGATNARSGKGHTLNIMHLLSHLRIPLIIRHSFASTCDAVQLTDYPKFLRAATCYIRDFPLRKTLAQRYDPICWNKRTLTKLSKTPGALDLLQAIMRGAILPWSNKNLCPVPGCQQTLTLHHALLADDRKHSDLFGIEGNLSSIPGLRTTKLIMSNFAQQHKDTLLFLSTRAKILLPDDTQVQDWTRWIITALQLRHI